jgi:Ser/Thr protein kinase RdoA (MazF antagonist)
MADEPKIERVLGLYPDDCQPRSIEPLPAAGGFSGARLWRVDAPRGRLCLRRWPQGHPTQERLEFIQAVLWHVDQEGFHDVPVPLETRHHHGYLFYEGHFWELTPWLSGTADFRRHPSPARLDAALLALASFHRAASTFPLPENGPIASPGIAERRDRIDQLCRGGIESLRAASAQAGWPELAARAGDLIGMFAAAAPAVRQTLDEAGELRVRLQPCIRDVWHAHVLFSGDRVSGIVDFGSLRPENVASDVARLLGSLVGDDAELWQRGLSIYQQTRPLAPDELRLVMAFDRSTVLLGGLQWLQWICLEGRVFSDRGAVLARLDEFLARMNHLPRVRA